MKARELTVETGTEPGLTDLTGACARFLAEEGAEDGLLTVFVPHATAGLVVVELGAGSDADLLAGVVGGCRTRGSTATSFSRWSRPTG